RIQSPGRAMMRRLARSERGASGAGGARSESAARELLGSGDAILWHADRGSRTFTFVSDAAERLVGYPAEVWVEAPEYAVGLVYPEDRPALLAAFDADADANVTFRMVSADGRLVWLYTTVHAVAAAPAMPAGLHGVMVDVTSTRQSQGRLLAQFAVTGALAESATLGEAAP